MFYFKYKYLFILVKVNVLKFVLGINIMLLLFRDFVIVYKVIVGKQLG